MKDLVSHIDSLILEYDCVIIPDFGGFVLNREPAYIANDGTAMPPKLTIGFNPELKYNDGLLAESYMNSSSLSYDAACRLIADSVKRMNAFFVLKHTLQVGKLGSLHLNDEGHIIFSPTKTIFYHPSVFGYSAVNIKRLSEIIGARKETVIASKRFAVKQLFSGVAAVAAAVLVFFLASTPVNEDSSYKIQKSGFLTNVGSSIGQSDIDNIAQQPEVGASVDTEEKLKQEPETAIKEKLVSEEKTKATKDEPKPIVVKQKEEVKQAVVQKETPKQASKTRYYIIVGGSPNKSLAERILAETKSVGFSKATLVNSNNRVRVAVASFDDRFDAEYYLEHFRAKNPNYKDAWVYASK